MLQWTLFNPKKLAKVTVLMATFLTAVFCFNAIKYARAQSIADQNSSLNQGVQIIKEPLGLPATDIRLIIARVIRVALGFLGVIFLALVIYGGYLWMTAGGNDEKIGEAKKVIINGIVGLIIILSAYAIVLFVMKLLGIGPGDGANDGQVGPPVAQNFQGSGGLGSIIKDHYPERNQKEVARNTKIIITFRRPIKMDSVAVNTNAQKDPQNAVFGDCINIGPNLDWKTDCDALKTAKDAITITRADNNTPISGASVLAAPDGEGKVTTIVIRPYEYLGSNAAPTAYAVHIGGAVLLDDATNGYPSIFKNASVGNNYYEWSFTCSTALDTGAPHVTNIFPEAEKEEARNSVIQISFNEAMDPTGVQGNFIPDNEFKASYFYLNGKNIFLKSGNSTLPLGNMALTNGYRTLEFTPAEECGINACGGKIYCLPVCDKPGANCDKDLYQLLLKAARTITASSFEAIPFSGLADVSGNALDGSAPYNDQPRAATTTLPIFNNWKEPDNFFWNFTLTKEIDKTSPFLKRVYPGLDAQFVNADEEWSMTFSKLMRVEPMYSIGIEQSPAPSVPLCRVPRLDFQSEGGVTTTITTMRHCPFIDTARNFYFPTLTSEVEDVHFNCFFPAKGPSKAADIMSKVSAACQANGADCCAVTADSPARAFCCNGVSGAASTIADCVGALRVQ